MAHDASRWRRILAAVISALLGLVCLTVALPPTLGAYATLGTDSILNRIQARESVDIEDVRRLFAERQQAMDILPSGRTATDIGLALLLLSESGDLDEPDQLSLRKHPPTGIHPRR